MRRYRLFWDSAVKIQKHVHCSIAVAYEYVLKNNLACGGGNTGAKGNSSTQEHQRHVDLASMSNFIVWTHPQLVEYKSSRSSCLQSILNYSVPLPFVNSAKCVHCTVKRWAPYLLFFSCNVLLSVIKIINVIPFFFFSLSLTT